MKADRPLRVWPLAARVLVRPGPVLRSLAAHGPLPSWQAVFLRFSLPLVLTSVILSQWLYGLMPPALPPESVPDPVGFGVYSVLAMTVGVAGLTLSAHYLVELFQGPAGPERAAMAVTLGLVPAWLGNVVAAFPWPWGNGLALALILYSLALLYVALRELLGLKPGNRIGLWAATLFSGAFITLVFGWALMDLIPGAAPELRLGTTWLI
ncbi:YIP1 family protein [Thioalkalivibrio sp. ALE23]|uniref:YIP1 family protein n=1 Tax=Thioalkalivibrio sp. ALE23 TaxID=1265495 RepID=UPI0003756152|nr:YIP1 family protein [Thioalkalivibrio sp. ALE23]